MPAKTTVHLMFPSHNKHLQVKRKLKLDGSFVDDKAKIHVPLDPKLATVADTAKIPSKVKAPAKNVEPVAWFLDQVKWIPGGKTEAELWIDAERGIQIRYNGANYVGPDGRMMYASLVKKHSRDLQTRGIDFTKFLWPGVIFILGIMAALIAMPLIMTAQGG